MKIRNNIDNYCISYNVKMYFRQILNKKSMTKKIILPVSVVILLTLGIFIGMKIQNAVSDDKISSHIKSLMMLLK